MRGGVAEKRCVGAEQRCVGDDDVFLVPKRSKRTFLWTDDATGFKAIVLYMTTWSDLTELFLDLMTALTSKEI